MTASDANTCKRELQIEVPTDVVTRETDTLVQKYQKHARIPGFRKGKVPAGIIRQRFAEDLKSDVIESLIPRFFREEVERQGLNPVSQPRVSDLHMHEGEPLRFKAEFEVLPEIEVTGYDEVKVERPEVAVTESEIDEYINNLREQFASFSSIEGSTLGDGDFAEVSFTGRTKDDPEAQPVEVPEVMVEIGGASTMKEFTENLRGASPGDERSFDVTYPEDFADNRLAGKTMSYTVRVKAVKQKNLPELNDEFAKKIGEFENLDALRARVRESMEHERKHTAEREAKDKIVEQLVTSHDFPVPDSLVEHQIDLRLERGLRALAAQGMRQEDMRRMDFPRLRDAQRDQARREVKASLILEKIADKEKIEVSDDEIDREVEALARQSQQPADAIRARLTKDGALDRIRHRIRSEKTLDYLYTRSA